MALPSSQMFAEFEEHLENEYIKRFEPGIGIYDRCLEGLGSCDIGLESDNLVVHSNAWLPLHPDVSEVEIDLINKELWRKFSRLNHEMKVTPDGRRLHPKLAIDIRNMCVNSHYYVIIEMEPVDNNIYRYKYGRSQWEVYSTADPAIPGRKHYHPAAPVNKPASGQFWMSKRVEFDKLKLSNNSDPEREKTDKAADRKYSSHILVNAQQRYQPKISIVLDKPCMTYKACQYVKEFRLPETQFIAVTDYCNNFVKSLKIETNPYAKGFRDKDKHRKEECAMFANKRIKYEENGFDPMADQCHDERMRGCPPSMVKSELSQQPLVSCSYNVVSPCLLSPSFGFRSTSDLTSGYIPNSYTSHSMSDTTALSPVASGDTYHYTCASAGLHRFPAVASAAAALYLQPTINQEHRK